MPLRRSALLFLFFVSGAAGLVYQVLWTRQLCRLAGNGSYAVAAVLSAFMAGLALGSRWLGRASDRALHPARTYGLLELGVGGYAFLLPSILQLATSAYVALFRIAEGHVLLLTASRFVLSFLILAPPTVLMGGTFPALLKAAAPSRQGVGRGVACLYAANTAGAVLGVLAGGFVLIRTLGVTGALHAAGMVNLALGLAAILLSPWLEREPDARVPAPVPAPCARWDRWAISAVAFLGGFAALGAEVLWTRILAVSFSSVAYSFAVMLSVFLLCLALGAAVIGVWADRIARPASWLAALHLAIAVALVGSLALACDVGADAGTQTLSFGAQGWTAYLGRLALCTLRVMGAPALLMGCAMPLLLRLASLRGRGLGEEIGRAYAANTWGATLGPLIISLLLVGWIGDLSKVLRAVSLVSVAAAAMAASLDARRRWARAGAALSAGLAMVFGASVLAGVGAPPEVRFPWFRRLAEHGAKVLHHEEGPCGTVTVVEQETVGGPRARALYTDSFEVAGTAPDYAYMRMIGHLPALLCSDPRGSALVIGFGTGTTSGALSVHPFDWIDIVDISPEVLRASRFFEAANRGVADGEVSTPRVRKVVEDGRLFLRASHRKYQVITAEPPLPYLAGSVNLYSRDFYEACAARLAQGGLMCQWMPQHFVRPSDYKSMLRSFLDVFPDATLWYYRASVLALGGHGALTVDMEELSRRMEGSPALRESLSQADVADPPHLLAGFLLDAPSLRDFVGDAAAVTDERPSLEFFTPGGRLDGSSALIGKDLLSRRLSPARLLRVDAKDPRLAAVERAWGAAGHLLCGKTLQLRNEMAEAREEFRAALAEDPDCLAARGFLREDAAWLEGTATRLFERRAGSTAR